MKININQIKKFIFENETLLLLMLLVSLRPFFLLISVLTPIKLSGLFYLLLLTLAVFLLIKKQNLMSQVLVLAVNLLILLNPMHLSSSNFPAGELIILVQALASGYAATAGYYIPLTLFHLALLCVIIASVIAYMKNHGHKEKK